MKSHWQLGRFFGIDVRVHATFLLVVLWALGQGWHDAGWRAGVGSAMFVMMVFLCIVLHELGHSLVARRYGIAAQTITLYPVGGVAGLNRLPRRPSQEIVIALAGPAVSLFLGALLLAARGGNLSLERLVREGPSSLSGYVEALAVSNFILAAFNLIPAFPMDGGRVLRAVLTWVVGYERATAIAAWAGQLLAAGFVALGWGIRSPFLMVLGIFLIVLARREARWVSMRHRLGERRVADLMRPASAVVSIPPDLPVEALRPWPISAEEEVPVVTREGQLVGLLDRQAIRRALRGEEGGSPVEAHMRRHFLAVPSDGLLREMIGWLPRGGQACYPVIQQGRYIGVLRVLDVMAVASSPPTPPGRGCWRLDLG